MVRRVEMKPETLDDVENFALLDDPDITLECWRCHAEIELQRLGGRPDAPVYFIRCPTDERHIAIEIHHRPARDITGSDAE